MFADRKARGVGDLVTVIIVEQAQARQSANTATGKESRVEVGPGLGVLADLIPCLGWAAVIPFLPGPNYRDGV